MHGFARWDGKHKTFPSKDRWRLDSSSKTTQLTLINYPSLIATNAARMVIAPCRIPPPAQAAEHSNNNKEEEDERHHHSGSSYPPSYHQQQQQHQHHHHYQLSVIGNRFASNLVYVVPKVRMGDLVKVCIPRSAASSERHGRQDLRLITNRDACPRLRPVVQHAR
jgi:hypothetical protein